MAQITFFEKPGCINNTKQKKWLEAAGHNVTALNILEQNWSKDLLLRYFGKKPIENCFNMTAPAIKSGELNPSDFDDTSAIKKMIESPILIKRPLINIDDTLFLQGFDKEKIDQLIGLKAIPGEEELVAELKKEDLTICPQMAKNTSCDEIKERKNSRPLGKLMEIVEAMGLSVTYAFDDLVFIEHNAFMFQFNETEGVGLYFNQECPETEQHRIVQEIKPLAETKQVSISVRGSFSMRPKDDEEIEIEFLDL